MKVFLGTLVVLVLGALVFVLWTPAGTIEEVNESETAEENGRTAEDQASRSQVTDGSYVLLEEQSSVFWSGKKPLIEGYVNTGSMSLKSGNIEVTGGEVTGEFIIDMNTMSVSKTPTKPGSESGLEGHLKGERWFNVAAFPEAKFVISEVAPRADTETTFTYDVKGDLTMKGETHEVSFPALIYTNQDGLTYASADFEFDRTLWGITAGSGSFFDNLADNAIDDMVALKFELVTKKN